MISRLCLALFLVMGCQGANILVFTPTGSHSHQNTYRPIFRELSKRGHNITYVTSLPDSNAPYHQIVVKDALEDFTGANNPFMSSLQVSLVANLIMYLRSVDWASIYLSDPRIQELIMSTDQHFDLVALESSVFQEVNAAFGHKFQAPTVELLAVPPSFWFLHVTGNPYSFSHTTSSFSKSTDRMNFMDRLKNTFLGMTNIIFTKYFMMPKQEALAREYFRYPGWENRPSLETLMANTSLVLQNTHPASHYPHPYNPNVIEISGIQLQEPSKLPQDLQTFLDNAKEGVVYVNFGTIFKGSMLPEKVKNMFLSVFEKLPYKILWKFETDSIQNIPKNVKISKWLPQKDLLAHPNIRMFITHGGLASMIEAIYHAVPMVSVPIAFDQMKNALHVNSGGYGVRVDFDNVTEDSITWAINKVAQPSYKENAKRQSMILRDNPTKPVDRAAYWIEYVIRHKGATHLRTPVATMPWYQYHLIDVASVLLLMVVLALYIVYFILRKLLTTLSRTSNNNLNKNKKLN